MSKVAVVDIDNTLWQFCDALYEKLRKVNQNFPPPESWTHWDLWESYCSKDDFFKAINEIHFNQDSDQYLPYPQAEGFLSSLRGSGYRITIASHRSPHFREQTERWLQKHGLVYDELHLSFHKTRLFDMFTDVVVDDAPQVLEKAVESGARAVGLLFPWNQAYSKNGFSLHDDLNEVLSHILGK
ncbi:MAG TPA: hypothetical protein DCP92_21520 [Nitrospiraceae bacterium]|jgi:phosphoglycolate phosphatase-like HAD superfamily hydrolase|nr:hypothetical protein [Nitrospiraceae bacterium]